MLGNYPKDAVSGLTDIGYLIPPTLVRPAEMGVKVLISRITGHFEYQYRTCPVSAFIGT